MRRPPDKDGAHAMSERDVDSSNATLNTLFGGSRQKSWMTGAGAAPVRPTPRASMSKASMRHASAVQKPVSAVFPSPAPSDEPSPVLSHSPVVNGSRHGNQQYALNDRSRRQAPGANQLHTGMEQPTRSEGVEQAQQARTVIERQHPVAPNHVSRPQALQYQVQNSQPPRTTPARLPLPSTILAPAQAPHAQEFASPTLVEQYRGHAQSHAAYPRPMPGNALTPSIATPPYPVELRAAGQPPQDQHFRPVPPAQAQTSIQAQYPSPGMTTANSTSSATGSQDPDRPQPGNGPNPSNPAKCQRSHVSAMPLLSRRVAMIKAHITSVGGTRNLNSGVERPRFQLLIEACNAEDAFYVALHQLFCVWALDRDEVANSLGLSKENTLDFAFKILGQLIRDNEGLASTHLKWFANFPSPLANLVKISSPYRSVLADVGIFLSKLTTDWNPLARKCATRGFPPLADELVNDLNLLSPILQTITFTATRRNLGIVDDEIGIEMESLFAKDRNDHQELASRYNTARPPTEKEVTDRNQALAQQYLMLHSRQRHRRRASGPTVGSPFMPPPTATAAGGSTHNQSTVSADGPSMALPAAQPPQDQSQGLGSQGVAIPDRSGSRQYRSQQAQPVRTMTAESSNPTIISMSGPLPNVPNQQSYPVMSNPSFVMQPALFPSPQGLQWQAPVLRSNNTHLQAVQGVPVFSGVNQNGTLYQSIYQPVGQITNQRETPLARHAAPQQQFLAGPQQQQQSNWPMQQLHHELQLQRQFQPQPQQQPQPQHQMQQQPQHQMQPQPQPQHQMQPQPQHQMQPQPQQQMQQQPQHQMQTQPQQQQQSIMQTTGIARNTPLRHGAYSRDLGVPIDLRNGQQHVRASSTVASPRPEPRPVLRNQANQTQPLQRPLVPPAGYIPPSQPINPDMTALHQAHIRSPSLVASATQSEMVEGDPSRRFFQSVKHLVLGPKKLPSTAALFKLEFTVSAAAFALVAHERKAGADRIPMREFRAGTLQYRLRCIQTKRDVTDCSVPDWVVSDTVWPETIFLEINSQMLELRRRNHHGKDLPVDITRYILSSTSLQDSVNRLKISVPRRRSTKEGSYFIGVEVIEVLQYKQIMDMCTQHQRIPEAQSLSLIRRSLSRPPEDQSSDDDFAMVVSDLSIDLADPFTARIFEIPVRGSNCLHRECFDLKTFLETRISKPKRPQQPSMVDVWKCPLCSRDARPYSLRIDDFLVSVRAELAAKDILDTKAILISADGTWRPKPEPQPLKRKATVDPDEEDDWTDNEPTNKKKVLASRRNSTYTNRSHEIEVIELDDD